MTTSEILTDQPRDLNAPEITARLRDEGEIVFRFPHWEEPTFVVATPPVALPGPMVDGKPTKLKDDAGNILYEAVEVAGPGTDETVLVVPHTGDAILVDATGRKTHVTSQELARRYRLFAIPSIPPVEEDEASATATADRPKTPPNVYVRVPEVLRVVPDDLDSGDFVAAWHMFDRPNFVGLNRCTVTAAEHDEFYPYLLADGRPDPIVAELTRPGGHLLAAETEYEALMTMLKTQGQDAASWIMRLPSNYQLFASFAKYTTALLGELEAGAAPLAATNSAALGAVVTADAESEYLSRADRPFLPLCARPGMSEGELAELELAWGTTMVAVDAANRPTWERNKSLYNLTDESEAALLDPAAIHIRQPRADAAHLVTIDPLEVIDPTLENGFANSRYDTVEVNLPDGTSVTVQLQPGDRVVRDAITGQVSEVITNNPGGNGMLRSRYTPTAHAVIRDGREHTMYAAKAEVAHIIPNPDGSGDYIAVTYNAGQPGRLGRTRYFLTAEEYAAFAHTADPLEEVRGGIETFAALSATAQRIAARSRRENGLADAPAAGEAAPGATGEPASALDAPLVLRPPVISTRNVTHHPGERRHGRLTRAAAAVAAVVLAATAVFGVSHSGKHSTAKPGASGKAPATASPSSTQGGGTTPPGGNPGPGTTTNPPPPRHFTEGALTVQPAEGWYHEFNQLGIPPSYHHDVLQQAGPRLASEGFAYFDEQAQEWRMNAGDGELPASILDMITGIYHNMSRGHTNTIVSHPTGASKWAGSLVISLAR
ncbi:MAG TPA: hypothetical protein VLH84_01240 [Patescibacteria group bacterium]|nr:hypothetical protein [Patescibacteria group bacterium]